MNKNEVIQIINKLIDHYDLSQSKSKEQIKPHIIQNLGNGFFTVDRKFEQRRFENLYVESVSFPTIDYNDMCRFKQWIEDNE